VMKETWIDIAYFHLVKLRMGKIKMKFGMDEVTPPENLDFVERIEMNEKFVPSDQLGVVAYIDKWDWFRVWGAVFNGNGSDPLAGPANDNNAAKDNLYRILLIPVKGLELGYARWEKVLGKNETRAWVNNYEFQYRKDLFFVQGEFYQGVGREQDNTDWYAKVGYGFPIDWEIISAIQPAVQFESYKAGSTGIQNDSNFWTIGLNTFIKNSHSKFQVNYVIIDDKLLGRMEEWRFEYQVCM